MIVVSGGPLSTVQARTPAPLVPVTPSGTSSPSATTANVCAPAASGPGTSTGDVHGVRGAPSSEHQYRDAPTAENDERGECRPSTAGARP